MFYVYILKSELKGIYYIGSCCDVGKRIEQHNKGVVPSTKRYFPWKLIHLEQYNDLRSARKREKQIKSWKKRSAIEKVIKHFKI